MFGPKLEARSYTTLLLIVVASLLTLNLAAQLNTDDDTAYSDAGASRQVARANQSIADATREVARSNQAIADSIGTLATAVKELGSKLESAGGVSAASGSQSGSAEAANYEYQGKFELN